MVTISKLIDYHVDCWRLDIEEVSEQKEDNLIEKELDMSNNQLSIANAVNFILTYLIDQEVPHNIFISNKGKTFFIIPRKFHDSSLPINTSWNDLVGLVTIKEQTLFENTEDENEIVEIIKEKVAIGTEKFADLTEKLIQNFDSIYEITKF